MFSSINYLHYLFYSFHTSKKAINKDGFIQVFNGKNQYNRPGDFTWWHVEDGSH